MGIRRVRRGDRFQLDTRASLAVVIDGFVTVLFDDGSEEDYFLPPRTTAIDRSQESGETRKIRADGRIVNALVIFQAATATFPKRGQCYVDLFVVRSERGAGSIARGYLYTGHGVELGEDISPGPGAGEGFIRTVTGTNPDAGDEVSEAVPTSAQWRLLDFSAVLVASGTGANRVPRLILDDGVTANRRYVSMDDAGNPVTASETRTIFWNPGIMNGAQGTTADQADTDVLNLRGIIPNEVRLVEGDRIRTVTGAIEADDDYAAPIYHVEEWIYP